MSESAADEGVLSLAAGFPPVDPDTWAETAREEHDGHAFVTYVRR